MKIYSWNVNGIRAVMRKNELLPFIEKEQPDILCLQELKAKPEQFELELPQGYRAFWYSGRKTWLQRHGNLEQTQAAASHQRLPEDIIEKYKVTGDTFGDPNKEGRVIAAEFEKFWVVTVYTPNAKDDLGRFRCATNSGTRLSWHTANELEEKKPVVFCGDLNVAHTEDDLANPKPNRGKKGFTDEERQGFQNFLDAGFVDTLRMYKQGNGHYTWWSHFAKSRERNVGWRIDYFLVSETLKSKVKAADIHPKVMGSDHCPISVNLDI